MASIASCFCLKPSVVLRPPSFPSRFQAPVFSRNSWKFHNSRVFVPVIRAGFDVASGIRPGGIVETDKLPSDVRKRAMDAVDACGGRVTIGDVASKGGLKLNEAQKALQALAADTNGFLEVSDEGDVLYVFPKDYRSKLAAKSFRIKLEPFVEKAKSAAEYLVRVSFGTALIASIVLVYTTIIALLSSRRYWDPYYYRRRRIQKEDDGMNFIESVFSFVFGDGDPNQGIEDERWKLDPSDGCPGFSLAAELARFYTFNSNPCCMVWCWCKLQIGQYISSNGGVVTAEELAPYLDLETADNNLVDESYILPVLLRFEGQPEVDEESITFFDENNSEHNLRSAVLEANLIQGNILYRFPSLQRTASSQRSGRKEYVGKRWTDWVDGVEKFFKEKKWQFSKTSNSERAMVIGLGGFNLFGVIILGTMLKNVAVTPSGFITFVSDIFPLLQGTMDQSIDRQQLRLVVNDSNKLIDAVVWSYVLAAHALETLLKWQGIGVEIWEVSGSFFAIPLTRWFLIRNKNAKIEKRNLARELRAQALELPDLSLRRKLLSARDMAQRTVIGQDRIVYSTDRDLFEQDYDTQDWDQRFREIEKNPIIEVEAGTLFPLGPLPASARLRAFDKYRYPEAVNLILWLPHEQKSSSSRCPSLSHLNPGFS
ncbi:Uncharacterized protein, chloroplastic [Vitis vinifera]|uniref:Uncharacterized protein, chloroplastic n=1 Tax=Vitis vinifera TaxID=29760 RepID=A0A438JS90_VITVI|nr:Uncharacterized protein, chloroplastic [Vitis vinifera]